MYTVNQIAPLVTSKLRGRTDCVQFYPQWADSTAKELSQAMQIEELKVTGPFVNFKIGECSYPLNYFEIPNVPIIDLNSNFNRIDVLFRYFNSTNPPVIITGGNSNSIGSVMKARAIQVVEPLKSIPGIPVMYAQYGKRLDVGFVPDQAYTAYMKYQRTHPDVVSLADNLYFPSDMKEILAYCIAIRACEYIGANELSIEYMKKLHGDPETKGDLGLIKGIQSKQERLMSNNSRQLQVLVKRY